ncbi:MAG: hypothetical protein J6Q02_06895, partial [Lachnospiraceae bacterium]|nr:hypothetical protein [Lachnospiraceae bacterium]
VFLAGWTGVFGRLISLSGLPLVWSRMIVSIVTLALTLLNPSERIQSIVARYMTGELDKENEANAAKTATAGDKNE